MSLAAFLLLTCSLSWAQESAGPPLPEGLYAEFETSKGRILARLEPERAPLTVANFVGLAEGTIANRAFPAGSPYFHGTTFHRVVPGHVIQGGIPKSEAAKAPGYMFPNEPHAHLSHNHAGALAMANSGPHTNNAQFYFTLADRSYLDGDYTVFGEVVHGLDTVLRMEQGDTVTSVRIHRAGPSAEAFRPSTESFQVLRQEAIQRVAEQDRQREAAVEEWIRREYPPLQGPAKEVRRQIDSPGSGDAAARFRYTLRVLRYMGHVTAWSGPVLQTHNFVSMQDGTPAGDRPAAAEFASGTKINAGLDSELAPMRAGERRLVIVPPAKGYGTSGFYRRTQGATISPNSTLIYSVEAIANP